MGLQEDTPPCSDKVFLTNLLLGEIKFEPIDFYMKDTKASQDIMLHIYSFRLKLENKIHLQIIQS